MSKRTRDFLRKKSVTKALRKQKLDRQLFGSTRFNNLHQYSKNKIHCSCSLCKARYKLEPKISDKKKLLNFKQQFHECKQIL